MLPSRLIAGAWLAFVLTWLGFALFAKRTRRRAPWTTWAVRLGIVAVIIVANLHDHSGAGAHAIGAVPLGWQWVGAVLCVLGLTFAVWARVHLGRNWGMPMSLREEHALVVSGPYAYVRHPIYTGILFAMLGSTLAVARVWAWALVLFFAFFLYSAFTEERMMNEQFPQAYPAYKARTRMLIPFIF